MVTLERPLTIDHSAISHQPCLISDLFGALRHLFQLRGLTAVQPLRDREGRVHANDASVEVELGYSLQAAGRTFLDADAAALAVVHEDLVETVRPVLPDDARLGTDQIAVVARVAGAAAEAAVGFLHRLLLGERSDHFLLRLPPRRRLEHRLPDPREVREVGHVHPLQISDDVDWDRALLHRLTAQHLVQIEGHALSVADSVDDHQRLARSELHDVTGGEYFRAAEASEAIGLDRTALGLELIRQPSERGALADGDDHVVDRKACRRALAIDRNRRRVDRAGELRRVELQRLDSAVAEDRGHRQAVHQLDAFLEHVVQILWHRRHLARVRLDGDHRHFFGALAQRLSRAVDRRVAAADDRHTRSELDGGRSHADVSQKRQAVDDAVFVLAVGSRAVRFDEADGEHDRVILRLELLPADVRADVDVGLDRDAELDEPFDLAIEHR